jgi:hypothetical protein
MEPICAVCECSIADDAGVLLPCGHRMHGACRDQAAEMHGEACCVDCDRKEGTADAERERVAEVERELLKERERFVLAMDAIESKMRTKREAGLREFDEALRSGKRMKTVYRAPTDATEELSVEESVHGITRKTQFGDTGNVTLANFNPMRSRMSTPDGETFSMRHIYEAAIHFYPNEVQHALYMSYAASVGDTDFVKVAMEWAPDGSFDAAATNAASEGHMEIVRVLLPKCIPHESECFKPYHHVCNFPLERQIEFIKLVDSKATVGSSCRIRCALNQLGNTNREASKYLVETSTDSSAHTIVTAINHAFLDRNFDVMDLLVKKVPATNTFTSVLDRFLPILIHYGRTETFLAAVKKNIVAAVYNTDAIRAAIEADVDVYFDTLIGAIESFGWNGNHLRSYLMTCMEGSRLLKAQKLLECVDGVPKRSPFVTIAKSECLVTAMERNKTDFVDLLLKHNATLTLKALRNTRRIAVDTNSATLIAVAESKACKARVVTELASKAILYQIHDLASLLTGIAQKKEKK